MILSSQPCNVAILAGGKGTRLRSRTGDLPKPMAPVLGRPVLEHLIDLCVQHGFSDIALLVHYEHETIRAHFGNGERFGARLHYCLENDARGTAGALQDALNYLDDRFLVLYGDTYADVNLRRLWDAHADSAADATLLLHPNDHPHDSDIVEVDANNRILAVHSYPHPEGKALANLVNAAMYAMQKAGLEEIIPLEGRFDLAKDSFPAMISAGRHLQGYITPEYIKDMGTPERLDKVERDVNFGLPERLSDRHLRRAVFLDRDGTINREVNHLNSPEQLSLLDGAGDAVRRLNRAGVLAICVTNQPVLARGDVTNACMRAIHNQLDHLLGRCRAYIDRLYLCPHHPDGGFPGEIPALKMRCACRKPATGMIDQAVREMQISRRESWLVGDTTSDIRAGRDSGLRTILVRSGHAGLDGKYTVAPDYILPDLAAAVDWILNGHTQILRELLPVVTAALGARVILIGGPTRGCKTLASQGLLEHLNALGRTAHIVSLDDWLPPIDQWENVGEVLLRCDLEAVHDVIQELRQTTVRYDLNPPICNGAERGSVPGAAISIGPDDTVIVEGASALLDERLLALADLRLFVDVDDAQRHQGPAADYACRGDGPETLLQKLAPRLLDEEAAVRASSGCADFAIYIPQGNL
jgi:histidinol-phosphate phosphatase family protein